VGGRARITERIKRMEKELKKMKMVMRKSKGE